jgi:hypothetical protein
MAMQAEAELGGGDDRPRRAVQHRPGADLEPWAVGSFRRRLICFIRDSAYKLEV